jgi:hypothetical protein
VVLTTSDDQHGASSSDGSSVGQLLGLCAAAPELAESAEDSAAALARRADALVKELEAKDGVHREKDGMLARKDEELRIARAPSTEVD